MPNTLVHIALNSISTKILIRKSELLWIYVGCIIPDIPWIILKIISSILPQINGYDLQVYAIIQSSLFFSIILSVALALLGKSRIRTFIILSIGSILHLLLDLIQIKWANGVILFAPFSWELTYYGIFWPENLINYIITFLGLLFITLNWKKVLNEELPINLKSWFFLLSTVLIIIYLLSPLLFIKEVYSKDNHFVQTLKNIEERENKYVELDRKTVIFNDSTNSYWIESFNRDLIELSEIKNFEGTRISVKGFFETNNRIRVIDFHKNWGIFRDGASYLGLTLILLVWGSVIKKSWA